jgi:hypothetical protein
MTTLRKTGWAKHGGESVQNSCWGAQERKLDHLEELDIHGRIILKFILQNHD